MKATQAKNQFGLMLKRALTSEPVFIEKHNTVAAVLLDIETYRSLVAKARLPEEAQLDALRLEFEEIFEGMQTAKSRQGVEALLAASPEAINAAGSKRVKSRA